MTHRSRLSLPWAIVTDTRFSDKGEGNRTLKPRAAAGSRIPLVTHPPRLAAAARGAAAEGGRCPGLVRRCPRPPPPRNGHCGCWSMAVAGKYQPPPNMHRSPAARAGRRQGAPSPRRAALRRERRLGPAPRPRRGPPAVPQPAVPQPSSPAGRCRVGAGAGARWGEREGKRLRSARRIAGGFAGHELGALGRLLVTVETWLRLAVPFAV